MVLDDATGLQSCLGQNGKLGTKIETGYYQCPVRPPTCLMCLEKSITLQGFHFSVGWRIVQGSSERLWFSLKEKPVVIC